MANPSFCVPTQRARSVRASGSGRGVNWPIGPSEADNFDRTVFCGSFQPAVPPPACSRPSWPGMQMPSATVPRAWGQFPFKDLAEPPRPLRHAGREADHGAGAAQSSRISPRAVAFSSGIPKGGNGVRSTEWWSGQPCSSRGSRTPSFHPSGGRRVCSAFGPAQSVAKYHGLLCTARCRIPPRTPWPSMSRASHSVQRTVFPCFGPAGMAPCCTTCRTSRQPIQGP